MTSPQEELPRHVIADMLRQVICGFECGEPHQHQADELIPLLAPLFAARVAAIEAELAEHQRVYGQMLDNVAERGRQRDLAIEEQAAERKRAERAEAERDHHRQGREDAQIAITKLIREREGWRSRAEKAEADLAASHDQHVRDAPVFIQTVHDLIAARAELAAMTTARDCARAEAEMWSASTDGLRAELAEVRHDLSKRIAADNGYRKLHSDALDRCSDLEQERDECAAELTEAIRQADHAEQRVAAERTQAAAQAWDQGWKASVRSPNTAPYSDDNPYRTENP